MKRLGLVKKNPLVVFVVFNLLGVLVQINRKLNKVPDINEAVPCEVRDIVVVHRLQEATQKSIVLFSKKADAF